MQEYEKEPSKENIIQLERNGKTFMIIEHFDGDKTYTDIVKSALRREFESD